VSIRKLSRLEIRKLVEVFIRDESGKIVKTSEEEGLKYFQNMAAETNRKVSELEKEMMTKRSTQDEELRTMWSQELARQSRENELSAIYNRIFPRILKQIQNSQMKGDDASVKGLMSLGNTLMKAWKESNYDKMIELDKNTAEWNLTEEKTRASKKFRGHA
jgi:hypothetical protein